jgi:VWFA-related protein
MSSAIRSLIGVTATVAVVAAAYPAAQQPTPRFGEHVDVARVILDARVLDDHGDALPGLSAGDFVVKIDGKPASVDTVTWVGGSPPEPAAAQTPTNPEASVQQPPGRLIVFLFQKDLEPSRIVGLMQMLFKSRRFLDALMPDDRVAVLSFESHLEIWTDFTNDRARLDRVLAHDVLFGRRSPEQAPSTPSLRERLTPATGRRTYGIEHALELIGEALGPLPGAKSLVLVGHGFGRLVRDFVMMENDFDDACRALVAARTSVFSLDVTNADYHSLEAGLQLVSEASGGFYARTHIFPDLAMRQLSAALAGYYVLFVERPARRRAVHDVEVKLAHRKGTVFAPDNYSERPGS